MPRYRENPKEGYFFPFGIPYISATLKKAGFSVFTVNLNHVEGALNDILEELIVENQIDVILTGGNSQDYHAIKMVFDTARKAKHSLITICGGGVISGDPVPAMTALEIVDYGVIGEGEATIEELCNVLDVNGDISSVRGIIYSENNSYHITETRPPIADIDTIPWPDYVGFNYGDYLKHSDIGIHGLHYKHAAMFLSARSCPFNCTFCFHTIGKKYRQRSLDDFFSEVDYLLSHYEIDFFYTHDELFTYSFKRAKEFCERIKKYNIPWQTALRVDSITDELLEVLVDANCKLISFGFESADNSVLESMKKHITVEQIEDALEKVSSSGISFSGAFIFGDKSETLQTARNTIEWWKNHRQYNIVMKSIFVYPGSELYRHAIEKGIIKDPVGFLKAGCPITNVSKMTGTELRTVMQEIVLLETTGYNQAKEVKLIDVESQTGFVTIDCKCYYCSSQNRWSHFRLFTTSFGTCTSCRGRQRIPLPKLIFTQIEESVKTLADTNRVALWGIANHAIDFINDSSVVQKSENVFLVDNSTEKQGIVLNSKLIQAPSIVKEEKIEIIVVFAVFYFATIKSQVETQYENVKVMSVYDLCATKKGLVLL